MHPTRSQDVRLRVAAIGDPHLAEAEFPWLLPVWDAVVARVAETRPNLVILTGDLFGGRAPNHLMAIAERDALTPRLRRLSDVAPVVIVKGNHDHPREFRWLASLSGRNRIRPIDEPGIHDIGDATVYALPYPDKGALLGGRTYATIDDERKAMIEALASRLQSLAEYMPTWRRENPGRHFVVISHGTPSGTTGDGTELYRPGGDVTMDPRLMEAVGADLWINGHIHSPAQLWPRGFDLGSFYPGGFGEGGRDRFWWLFDLVDNANEGYPHDDSLYTYDLAGARALAAYRFPTGAPRRFTHRFGWDGTTLHGTNATHEASGSHIRIVVTADEAHEASIPWDRIEAAARSAGALSVTRTPDVHRAPREVRAPALAKATTDLDRLIACVESAGDTVDEAQRLRLRDAIDDPARDRVADLMRRVGKARAGRLLDGRTWDEYPGDER